QFKRMSEQAREALGSQEFTALADRGYYSGEEIKACDDAGIVPLVPKVFTSNSKAEGRYDKSDFVYEPARDAFRCPAGEYAIRRFTSVEKGMAIHRYWSSACPRCARSAQHQTTDASADGNMRPCSTRCRNGSTPAQRRCRCDGRSEEHTSELQS